MRVYIAGPMTGLPDFNYPAFFKAAEALSVAGHEPLNPAANKPEASPASWLDFMRMSLIQIAQADGIALLPGWQNSRGAAVEYRLGHDLGLDVRRVDEWLEATS